MLVLLALASLHVLLWQLHRPIAQPLAVLTLLVVTAAAFAAGLVQLELTARGMTTYGSDAELYWREALHYAHGVTNYEGLLSAPGLIMLHALVLRTALGDAFEWVLAAQIGFTSLCANLIYAVLAVRVPAFARPRWRGLLLFAALFANGIVLWAPLRGLKEMLLLCLLAIIPWAFEVGRAHRHPATWVALGAAVAAAAHWLGLLRPGMQYAPLAMAAGAAVSLAARRPPNPAARARRLRAALIGALGAVGLVAIAAVVLRTEVQRFALYFLRYAQLTRGAEGALGGAAGDAPVELAFGPGALVAATVRFLLGPGPVRAFQQIVYSNVFEVSTKVGDVLVFLGALEWWATLAVVAWVVVRRRRVRPLLVSADYLAVNLVHVASYVFVYSGTGDSRHRAVMYVLALPAVLGLVAADAPALFGECRPFRPPASTSGDVGWAAATA